jgi:hypothetical protein
MPGAGRSLTPNRRVFQFTRFDAPVIYVRRTQSGSFTSPASSALVTSSNFRAAAVAFGHDE